MQSPLQFQMIFNDSIDDEIRRGMGEGGGWKGRVKFSPPLAGVFIQGLGREIKKK